MNEKCLPAAFISKWQVVLKVIKLHILEITNLNTISDFCSSVVECKTYLITETNRGSEFGIPKDLKNNKKIMNHSRK